MATKTLKKEIDKARLEQRKKLERQLKKFDEKHSSNAFINEQKHDEDILEMYAKLSPSQRAQFNKELEYKKIRENFASYVKYVHPKYILTKFHAMLCSVMQSVIKAVENGEMVRLCLSVPPQCGKSYTTTETLPSWFLGRNPDMRVIVTGYNADMAERFGNENRQLIKKHGKDVFGVEISDSQDNKTLWKLDNHEGGLYSAGILGGITGNPGSLIIVDDPYRNEEDMNNNEKIWRTFTSSIITRASGKGNAIIVIHTRWNDDDLIGRLVKLGWAYINIPAIWEKGEDKFLHRKVGETICPEIGKDAQFMEMQRKTMGERQFSALYQGKPYIDSGNYVKRENIKWYNAKSKPSNFEELTLSCDLTFGETKKTNDPYCMTLWGRNGADHYLLKIWDKRANFTDTIRTLQVICAEHPQLRRKIVEKKANGKATYDMLNSEIGGFILFDPKNDSKETRLNSVTPYFESGNVYFPDESLCENIETFVEQLLRFPACEHDDFVDTISQYLLNYEYRYGGEILTDNCFATLSNAFRGIKI